MAARRTYLKETLEPIVKSSISVMEVMHKLGVNRTSGGMHSHISKRIREFGLDTTHFLGRAANSGLRHRGGLKSPAIEQILIVNNRNRSREKTHLLRKAMLAVGIPHCCSSCGLTNVWNNKPLCLQIEHKNGNYLDNRKENLCFLCPNCHTQTKTYGSLNISPE